MEERRSFSMPLAVVILIVVIIVGIIATDLYKNYITTNAALYMNAETQAEVFPNYKAVSVDEDIMAAGSSKFDGAYTDPDNTNGEWKNSVTVNLKHFVGIVNMYYVSKYCWTTSTDIPPSNAEWKEPENASSNGLALKPVTTPTGVEGEYYLHLYIRCEDSTYSGYVYTGPYYIDDKAPSTPAITNPSGGNWTNKDVTITAKSTDNGSGIQYMYWDSSDGATGDVERRNNSINI